MIYPFTLKATMLAVGFALILTHLFALVKSKDVQAWLRAFPRSKTAGVILTAVAAGWFLWLVMNMDLGEFTPWKRTLQVITPVTAVLAIFYMKEFLAVRALGMIGLLAAEPMLEAAFLRDESSRLLLVVFAYVLVVLAMFWVGMPYTMRDQIGWVSADKKRWQMASLAGAVFGAALCAGGLLAA